MSQVTVRRVFSCSILVLLIAAAGYAQLATTAIHGIVRDPSGAVIPNGAVKTH